MTNSTIGSNKLPGLKSSEISDNGIVDIKLAVRKVIGGAGVGSSGGVLGD